jgi:hypothetical protein
MATRGQIAYLADPNTIFSVYVNYDAYPDHLGKVLNTHFNSDNEIKDLVTDKGDVRFIGDDGIIERYNNGGYKLIKGEDTEDLFNYLYDYSDGSGVDYVYVWLENKWVTLPMNKGREYFMNTLLDQIGQSEISELDANEITEAKDKFDLGDWISDMLKYKSYDEVLRILKNHLNDAMEERSVGNKFDSFKAAMDNDELDETFVRQMKYKAGIIK